MGFPTFESSLKELEKIEAILDRNYPKNTSILNRNIGIYKILKNIISNLKLLRDINVAKCATQPFATLSRMVIDNYAILFLISSYSSLNERDLRYYLYLIDSLEGRINSITDFSKQVQNNGLIMDFQQSEDIIENDKRVVNKLLNQIKENNLDELVSSKIIDKRNWKFTTGENKNERLSWVDLYNIARIPQKFSKVIQNHYSTFTHGLGMTILYESRNETFIESTFLLLSILNLNIVQISINEYQLQPDKMDLDPQLIIFSNHQWEKYKEWN